ncbi:unnamed protein product [Lampetra fluviatilis]
MPDGSSVKVSELKQESDWAPRASRNTRARSLTTSSLNCQNALGGILPPGLLAADEPNSTASGDGHRDDRGGDGGGAGGGGLIRLRRKVNGTALTGAGTEIRAAL